MICLVIGLTSRDLPIGSEGHLKVLAEPWRIVVDDGTSVAERLDQRIHLQNLILQVSVRRLEINQNHGKVFFFNFFSIRMQFFSSSFCGNWWLYLELRMNDLLLNLKFTKQMIVQ